MSHAIPRVLWTLWLQGWEQSPALVQACLRSWQLRNPTWTVRALTRENIGTYVDLAAAYPAVDLDRIPAPALSDMIRVALLAEHGGVWADSTVFCVTPLDQWVDECSRTGFFAFCRPGPDRMVSSWFLASEPHHPLTTEWQDRVREYWRTHSTPDRYFWFHHLFADAYGESETFRQIWDATPKLPSDGPHYFVPYNARLAGRMTQRARARVMSGAEPVYKLCHRVHPSDADPESAHDFFLQWADGMVQPLEDAARPGQRPILAVDRVGERVRWTYRHARAGLAGVLRNAGVSRSSGAVPIP
jgi:hypothetical protein